MNAVDFLRAHHRQMEAALARFHGAPARAREARLVEQLADALATHAQLENRLYAAIEARTGDETLAERFGIHVGIASVMAGLLGENPESEGFSERMRNLRERVRHHIRKDELEVFPTVRRLLSDSELEDLGQELERELIRIYGRGIPRRLFESAEAFVPNKAGDGGQTKELLTSTYQ